LFCSFDSFLCFFAVFPRRVLLRVRIPLVLRRARIGGIWRFLPVHVSPIGIGLTAAILILVWVLRPIDIPVCLIDILVCLVDIGLI
jgi:hypothetical protein